MTCHADIPLNERERLERLYALAILDTEPETMFDALTLLASEACDVPIALISLVDSDRQWFKSNVGLPGMIETPRDISFCSHTICSREIMEVRDALLDPRFAGNPLVTGEPDIRFYAGAPITVSGGLCVGTLSVIAQVPKKLSINQLGMLRQLAVAVAQAMEFREKALDALASAQQTQEVLRQLYTASPAMLHATDATGKLLFVSDAWLEALGYAREEAQDRSLLDFLSPTSGDFMIKTSLPQLWGLGRCDDDEYELVRKDGTFLKATMSASLIRDEQGRPLRSLGVAKILKREKSNCDLSLAG